MTVIITILIYFAVLWFIATLTSKGGNADFFTAGRRSPWPLVAFGMIGASISGVTFIGVPGWVMGIDMTYIQMCLGFIVGYLVVAFVLLPIYYKVQSPQPQPPNPLKGELLSSEDGTPPLGGRRACVSIYLFLYQRLGSTAHRTGASFFIVSKLLGAAAKFYVVCEILQLCLPFSIPYFAIVAIALLMIWLYTRRSGMKTLVWTDALQTLCLIVALVLIFLKVSGMLGMSFGEAMSAVWNDSHCRMFEWSDWHSSQHFVKQFLSGVFVVIVMTGLDQDMMQKNLTCKTLRDAQKDMCAYGVMFAPVNFMFMALGVLLLMLYSKMGIALPAKGDALLANIVLDGTLGTVSIVLFTIGVVASAFSSADSALTSLTTSFTVDILKKESDESTRKAVHIGMLVAFIAVTLAFHAIGTGSVMDLIYTLVSYTYGPLLGIFAFALLSKRKPQTHLLPLVAIIAPVVCYAIDYVALNTYSYKFGYEILLLNGFLTYVGFYVCSQHPSRPCADEPSTVCTRSSDDVHTSEQPCADEF